jgi:hypothetical protein
LPLTFTIIGKMSKPWRTVFLLVALAVVPALLPFAFISTCAGWFRWSGALYQIAGLITVLWGINALPEAFGLPPMLNDAGQWLAKRLRLRGPVDQVVRPPTVISDTRFGRPHVKQTGTIDQRLDRLEDQLYQLTCEMDEKLLKLKDDIGQRFEDERSKVQQAITKLEGQVKEATLGNRYIELFGVASFAVGIVLSALA